MLSTLAILALGSLSSPAIAQAPAEPVAHSATLLEEPAPRTKEVLDHYDLSKSGLAIDGYDPVSYFPAGGSKPAKGSKKITTTYRGVTYRFASEANKKAFLQTPAAFEPAYGGWCAYAAAKGSKTSPDPKNYLIEDGRLLLFYKGFFGGNTKTKWTKEGPAKLRPKADAYWEKLTGETPPAPTPEKRG